MKTILYVALSILLFTGCSKEVTIVPNVPQQLYTTYKNGEISECKLKGQKVYTAGINAVDAGYSLYDLNGKQICNCSFGWGPVDARCQQLDSCEVIYCVANNIWGRPAVDKYQLGKN